MGMTPAQEAQYALDFDVDPGDLSPAARAEYDRLRHSRPVSPAGFPPQARQQPRPSSLPGSAVMMGVLGGAGLLLHFVLPGIQVLSYGGISLDAGQANQLCNSGVGTYGQIVSATIRSKCALAGAAADFATLAGVLGVLLLIGAAVAVAQSRSRSASRPA